MGRTLSLTVSLWLAASTLQVSTAIAAGDSSVREVDRDVDRALGRTHQRSLPGLDPLDPRDGDGGELDGGGSGGGASARGRDGRDRRERRLDPRTHRPRDPGDRAPVDAPPTGPLSDLASMLLWGLVAVGAIVIGATIYRQAAGYTGDDEAPARDRKVTDEQLAAVVERPRDDADELAAQGRFADAIHTLLLRTLHELASQHLVRVTPSMTSREILARVALQGEARAALAGLIVAVEQTWFGDEVPSADDYQRCRAQFDRFATAYRRGAAAAQGGAAA